MMHIVRRVARGTLPRRAAVALTHVTGRARHVTMFVVQWEARFLMVERNALPSVGRMALLAFRTEAATMRVVGSVACDAGCWSFTERTVRAVAAVATNGGVRPLQMKVGEFVIKAVAAEMHDVGVSTVMLAVTSSALARARRRHAAMKATACGNVGRDVFVAVKAQSRLA